MPRASKPPGPDVHTLGAPIDYLAPNLPAGLRLAPFAREFGCLLDVPLPGR